MLLKNLIFTLLIGGVGGYISSVSCAETLTPSRFVCEETVGCGPTVKVEGNKVILDRNLIIKLAKKPSLEVLEKNLWEIVYFVSIADREAMSAAIDIIVMIPDPRHLQIDDPYGIRPLARALTQTDHFWSALSAKPLSVRKKVLQYLDVNKSDYTLGHDYEEEKRNALSK